jgi:hypothetical protein
MFIARQQLSYDVTNEGVQALGLWFLRRAIITPHFYNAYIDSPATIC